MGEPEGEAQQPAPVSDQPDEGAEPQPEPQPGQAQPAPPDDGEIKPENTWEG